MSRVDTGMVDGWAVQATEAIEGMTEAADVNATALATVASACATLAVAAEIRALREALPGAMSNAVLEGLGDGTHFNALLDVVRGLGGELVEGVERVVGAEMFARRGR